MTSAADIETSNVKPVQDPHTSTGASENRINGVFNLTSPRRVAGWAIDRADPNLAVDVEIYCAGKLIARARANEFRPDLESGGVGTGRYGFSVEIDPPIELGLAFTLTARAVTSDGEAGRLRPIAAAAPSKDPKHRLLESLYLQILEVKSSMEDFDQQIKAAKEVELLSDCKKVLERIEMLQTRLELVDQTKDLPLTQNSGLEARLMVGAALVIGVSALLLGLWSIFG